MMKNWKLTLLHDPPRNMSQNQLVHGLVEQLFRLRVKAIIDTQTIRPVGANWTRATTVVVGEMRQR
jgi:hypothetical protein